MFTLHPQLAKDTYLLGKFTLSQLLLSRDANYPWFILVPQRDAITELHHLHEADQQQLLLESMVLSLAIEEVFFPDKLNIAALGNQVSQLHVHHIARFKSDCAWPKPIWGAVPSIEYQKQALIDRINGMITRLQSKAGFCPS